MKHVHVDPGGLRMPLVLEEHVPATDDLGGQTDVWSPVAMLWGILERIDADAALRSADDEQLTTVRIILRADPRVRPAMRFVAAGRPHLISTVHDADGTGRYLVCTATEGDLP